MIRNVLAASLLMLGLANCAGAQDYGPHLVGGGEDAQLVYSAPSHNLAGGGFASLSGGAEEARVTYGPKVQVQAQNGLVASMIGGGEDRQLVYLPAGQSSTMLAGQARR